MIPQDQEFLHDSEKGIQGDCARAVIASLLELPIAEVPHFMQLADEVHGFWNRLYDWREGDPDLYHEMSGPSPRGNGTYHAIVGKNGKPFFDPHPSRAMLGGDPTQWRISVIRKK